jgi:energy-coupling factor transporter ATP-binding protein EcfA2
MDAANFAVVSPRERTGLVMVSPDMLHYPYQVRYELIEFAVFVLASRAQGLVPLHAACVGRSGRGLLLIGSSGAGKSTLALHCLMLGMNLLAEDSVFVHPERMLATGISNFLHLRRDSLPFVDDKSVVARIRKSPMIRRRSGVEKYEVDVRGLGGRVASSALRIEGIVFLSTRSRGRGAALVPLPRRTLLRRLTAAQPYPAQLPSWKIFVKHLSAVRAFELRRGQHPTEAAVALRLMLD